MSATVVKLYQCSICDGKYPSCHDYLPTTHVPGLLNNDKLGIRIVQCDFCGVDICGNPETKCAINNQGAHLDESSSGYICPRCKNDIDNDK